MFTGLAWIQEKSKESENRMQELENQLQSLQLRNEQLHSENQILKLAKAAAYGSSSDDTQARPWKL